MEEFTEGCLLTILIVVFCIALSFAAAGIGMWLWGAIMVPVFGLPALSYWQTFGLIWLIRILMPNYVSSSSKK